MELHNSGRAKQNISIRAFLCRLWTDAHLFQCFNALPCFDEACSPLQTSNLLFPMAAVTGALYMASSTIPIAGVDSSFENNSAEVDGGIASERGKV